MKTKNKMSITKSKNTSIPKAIAPYPVMYQKDRETCLVWDIFGQDQLSSQLGEGWHVVEAKKPGESDKYRIKYAIVGGQENHAFDVEVEGAVAGEHDIEWIYIRSMTGGQFKLTPKDKDAHVLFAMAAEDAYMFCQNDPCIECAFGCKLGFEIYAYSKSEGLIKDAVKIVFSVQSK